MRCPIHAALASSLVLSLVACADPDDPPPPPPAPSPLARCAAPSAALTTAWQVDNIHAPITAVTASGTTIVVGSADGAVKLWHLARDRAAELRPGYGTPLREAGPAVTAVAATADGTAVTLDNDLGASAWRLDGTPVGAALAVTEAPAGFAAVDATGTRLAAASDAPFAPLALTDLSAATPTRFLETSLWHLTGAAFTDRQVIAVGDWYGCPGVEVRDHDGGAPATWDDCNGAGGGRRQGWFRAVATSADGTTALAVGDGVLARFDLADVTAGPTAIVTTDLALEQVALLEGDGVLVTLGRAGDAAELTFWDLDDLTRLRSHPAAAGVGLTVEPTAGIAVVTAADGTLTGLACAP